MASETTLRNYILEVLKRRAMNSSELAIGSALHEDLVKSELKSLENEGLVERRAGLDYGLTEKAKQPVEV